MPPPCTTWARLAFRTASCKSPPAWTPNEWDVMQTHPEIGAEIIGQGGATESLLLTTAASIALTHHEKWNGSGYPRGLVRRGTFR